MTRAEGSTRGAIARHLNVEGYLTRRGRSWTLTQVKSVHDRLRAA